MKNTFLSLATIISFLALGNTGHAQNSLVNAQAYYINPCDETIFNAHYISGVYDTGNSNEINPQAIKHFKKQFQSVPEANWSKTQDDGYIVKFTTGAVQTMVAYNKKGNWHHTINYYDEKDSPLEIRKRIKGEYFDYTVLKIAEVHFSDQVVYITYIQDDTHLKVIRIHDGEMEVVGDYTRG